ncbi:MAG TPA: hypothetical protein VD789_10970 [Thermomicrobiales bacterium]|nr:hypothetical protein [Thermomicrobiales bacterium]
MLSPADVIRACWERVQARHWEDGRKTLHDHIEVDWPASNERILGPDDMLAVNHEYPEGWSIRVLEIRANGHRVAREIEVPMAGEHTLRVASFWPVQEKKISKGTESWISLGQDDVPTWHQRFTVPVDEASLSWLDLTSRWAG